MERRYVIVTGRKKDQNYITFMKLETNYHSSVKLTTIFQWLLF